MDFEAPDVDVPAAPLPADITDGAAGVSVCSMMVGCGPHALFKHLFWRGSGLSARVSAAQVRVLPAHAPTRGRAHLHVRISLQWLPAHCDPQLTHLCLDCAAHDPHITSQPP